MFRVPTQANTCRSQRRARAPRGSLLAAVVLFAGLAAAPAFAGPASAARSERAAVDFRIVIPPSLRMRIVREPAQIVVTERDAKAGYVELPDGVELEVVSNLRAGLAMMVQVASPVVKSVEVSGLGAPMKAGHEAAAVRFPRSRGGATRTLLNLGFRILLAHDVAPGIYDWPVSLTIMPA